MADAIPINQEDVTPEADATEVTPTPKTRKPKVAAEASTVTAMIDGTTREDY
jgi:hypothetical protein